MSMNATIPELVEQDSNGSPGGALEDMFRAVSPPKPKSLPQTPGADLTTRVGKLMGMHPSGQPLVDFPDNPASAPISARHICPVWESDVGRETVTGF